jgi:UDP-GlcNAc:undecaprenyl-phosphate GlcNAc-1-phosphate transferase
MACLIAAGVTALLIAILRPLAAPLGLIDHPNDRKHHVGAVPLIGGLALFGGTVAANLFYGAIGPFRLTLIETAVVMAVIGALDDRHDLSVRVRLFAQVACVLCVILSTGVYITSLGHVFGRPIELGLLGIPFTVVAVIGLLNAFNMMDGIDGLAGSQALVSVCTLMVFDHDHNLHGMIVLMGSMAAATVPYLLVNLGLTKRKVFLGDAGSMVIGYLLSWTLIRFAEAPESQVSPTDVLWCVSVPVLDTLTVMGRRLLEGKSPFKPDRGHIHHVLLRRGFSPRQTLIFLLVLSCVLSLLGTLTRQFSSGVSILAFCGVAVVYAWASFREFREYQATMSATPRTNAPVGVVANTPRVSDSMPAEQAALVD